MGVTSGQPAALCLIAVVVLLEVFSIGSKPLGNGQHGCSACPPGYEVSTACSDTQDSRCKACAPGTYSNASDLMPCYPCSRCGDDLFELHPCSALSDVFCEICTWENAKENPDFKRKCLGNNINTNSKGDKSYYMGRGNVLDYHDGKSNNVGWLGDQPQEKGFENVKNDSGGIDEPGSPKDGDVMKEGKSPTPALVDSGGKSNNGPANPPTRTASDETSKGTIVTLKPQSPTPIQKHQNATHETLNDNSSHPINQLGNNEPSTEQPGVPYTEYVDAVNSTISDDDLTSDSEYTVDELHGDEVSTEIGQNNVQEITSHDPWDMFPETSSPLFPLEATPKTKAPNQNLTIYTNESAVLVVGQSVDSSKGDDNAQTSAFGVVIAALTSGIVFFAIGFFINRNRREPPKAKKISVIYTGGHDPVMTWDDDVTCTRLQFGDDAYQEHSNMRPTEYTEMVPREQKADVLQAGIPQVMISPDDQDNKTPLIVGNYQSPVNIEPEDADVDEGLEGNPLIFKYIPKNTKGITNNGALMRIDVDGTDSLLRGGPLNHQYQLDHIHFHWGSTDDRGSEHTIKGSTFAAEIHFVHWNSDLYTSFAEAVKAEFGLAIVGVLVEIGQRHNALQTITDLMPYIRYKGESRDLGGAYFDPKTLLSENTVDYWTYQGSMTIPPFYESVTWIVFKEPMEISRDQINAFRHLLSHERDEDHGVYAHPGDGRILHNNRATLPLGDRTVKASFM